MSLRIDRVSTRSGDGGTTGLIGGRRVSKACLRVETYGQVDELTAVLGVARAMIADSSLEAGCRRELCERLDTTLHELFDLGNELAAAPGEDVSAPPQRGKPVTEATIADLEKAMEGWNEGLPALASFVLPGAGLLTAQLHVARTVCRRVERAVWRLADQEPVRGELPRYLNRLSDALFVLARFVASRLGEAETLWRRS